MRYPGDDATRSAPGRRQGQSGADQPARRGRRAEPGQPGQPGRESFVFSPGYGADRRAAARQSGEHARPGSRYGWAGSAAGKGPVRGYPPAQGQPPPLYPPGQFAAWNRAPHGADGAADTGDLTVTWLPDSYAGPGQPGPGSAESGNYPALAVSDPAADVTSTQSWGRGDGGPDAGGWTAPPVARTGSVAPAETTGAPGRTGTRPAGPGRSAAWPPLEEPRGPDRRGTGFVPSGPAPSGPGRGPDPGQRAGSGQRTGPGQRGGADGSYGAVADYDRSGRRGQQPKVRRRGRRSRRLLVAISLVACVALGAGIFVWLSGRHSGTTALPPGGHAVTTPQARPTPSPSPSPKAPPGPWRFIGTRASDPTALTAAQLFPLRFSASGASYSRTVRRIGKKCSAAVVGSQLQTAVSHAGCSQVLRASYLSRARKQMGTIGVLNLKSFSAARKAGKSAGAAQFIQPLNGPKGPTRNLSKATGLEEAEVKGHYLILVLADFTDLKAPGTRAQRRALETFLSELIKQTVNISLTTRMVTGKP